jgi:hypothetical protein
MMIVDGKETNCTKEELKRFQEAFRGADGAGKVIAEAVTQGQLVALDTLRHSGASENQLRHAQGEADALDEILARLVRIVNADLDAVEKEEAGQSEDTENVRPIVTP